MVQAIPSYANPCEYGYYLALNVETTFNEMMQEIGISELHSLEENGVIVLEDGDSQATEKKVNKFTKFLSDRWEDIKNAANKVLEAIKGLVEKAKKKIMDMVGSNKSKVEARLKLIKKTDKNGKAKVFGKGWDFNDKEWSTTGAGGKLSSIVSAFKEAQDNISDYKSLESKLSNLGINASDKSKGIRKIVDTAMCGEKEIDITYDYIDKNFSSGADIWGWATSYELPARGIGKELKSTEKTFNDAIRNFKKTVDKKNRDEAFKATANGMKTMATCLSIISTAVCSNVRKRTIQSIRIALRVCLAAKQKEEAEKKEKAVGESYIPNSFQTELASLFNF